jgi:DNA-binding NarL/FixJ family response regulator
MPTKVLVADDAEVILLGIRMMLRGNEEIQIVGEASSFSEAIGKTAELRPDVLVIDLHLAKGRFAELKSAVNGTKILAISFACDEEAEDLARDIGAVKFLDKMALAQEMIPTILQLVAPSSNHDSYA